MASGYRLVVTATLLIILLEGCAARRPSPAQVLSDPRAPESPAAPAGEEPEALLVEEPVEELSLRDALTLTVSRNPDLAAFSWEVRAREAWALQEMTRTNPELTVEVENFAGDGEVAGFRSTETTVTLSQLVELGGKRQKRGSVARLDREAAQWDYESKRIELLAETAVHFVDVLLAQEALVLAGELVGVAERIFEGVTRQVEAGAASPVEESRARVALETSRVDSMRAALDLNAARKILAASWGSTTPRFKHAVGDLEEIKAPPTLENLISTAGLSPRLARSRAEMDRSLAESQLQRALRLPDLTVGAGARRFAEIEDNAFVFELGVSLPLFDRNQGAAQAAAHRVAKAKEENRAEELRVRADISVVYEELSAAETEARALRDRIVPEAEQAFAKAQEAYRRGLLRFTDVLDTERTLFELRGRYFAALARYHKAVARAESLTGKPLFGSAEH